MSVWIDYTSNQPARLTETDTLVFDGKRSGTRHIVERRNGDRVWLAHKCINCRAATTETIAFIRQHDLDEGDRLSYYSYGAYAGPRLHEVCLKCRRTQSWPYKGVAPKGWKQPEMAGWKRVRDFQRSRLYKWQSTKSGCYVNPVLCGMASTRLTWDEQTKLVAQIFGHFSIPMCEIQKGSEKEARCWMRGRTTMRLNPGWGSQPWVAVHEAAHAVVFALHETGIISGRISVHGKEFTAVYCVMAEIFLNVPCGTNHLTAEEMAGGADLMGLACSPVAEARKWLQALTEKRVSGADPNSDIESES